MRNNLEKCEFKTFFSVFNRVGIKSSGEKAPTVSDAKNGNFRNRYKNTWPTFKLHIYCRQQGVFEMSM